MEEIIAAIGSPSFSKLAGLIAAVGALGAAAAGLVDTTKFLNGGISNAGYKFIRRALDPFKKALERATGSSADWQEVMKAHWLNGRAKDEQKAIAKSLIRLGLDDKNAEDLASKSGVEAEILKQAAIALRKGEDLTPHQMNVLGRFDASVEARLDAAFERADQFYRNSSKALAAGVAIILAIVAGGVLFVDEATTSASPIIDYIFSRYFLLAIIVGAVAVPLAPVSKDIVSALGTAVRAMKATKG